MNLLNDLTRAVAQITDPAFRSVLWRALGLSVLLLAGVGGGLLWLLMWVVPDSFTLPWFGGIENSDMAVAIIAIPVLLILSIFAMFPVAALFVGLFLDKVADAVEARHYPHLAPNRDVPLGETLAQGGKMALLIIGANLIALIAYVVALPLAPLLYWGLNGYLLGREFFQQAAVRRMPVREARSLRRANRMEIWLLGVLIALPMSIPIINLVVPVIGAAAFTHLFHRLRPL